MEIEFEKYQGCGNDFIIINENEIQKIKNISSFTKNICDRHFGIGADGLIYPSFENNLWKMNYYNSDGSFANMCGNGMRCFVKWLYSNNKISSKAKILTTFGSVDVEVLDSNLIVVNMGKGLDIKEYFLNNYKTYYTLMHVDHLQIFVENIPKNWKQLGKNLEKNPMFENKTNVNFVQVINENTLNVYTWERGAGATLACGSGVCASVWTYINKTKFKYLNIKVHVLGGTLEIKLNENCEILMTGPAKFIATGLYKGE